MDKTKLRHNQFQHFICLSKIDFLREAQTLGKGHFAALK